MSKIIEIIEENNELRLANDAKIICGNSNYKLKFILSEDWRKAIHKAVVFCVCGKKITQTFVGDECVVPIMSGGGVLFVSLVAGDEDMQLATTEVRIELVETFSNVDFVPFEPLKNDLSSLIDAVNNIENGNIEAQKSKYAEFANNVSNKNLLINGDFRVNQRANSSYKGSMVYSVDRWVLGSAMSFMNYDNENKQIEGIGVSEATSTGTPRIILRQFVEDWKKYIGKTLTLSMEYESFSEDISGSTMLSIFNGKSRTDIPLNSVGESGIITATRTIPEDSTNLVAEIRITGSGKNATLRPKWIKLEEGNQATNFTAKSYAEELALCQRYYQILRLRGTGFSVSNGTYARSPISINTPLRVSPTLIIASYPYVRAGSVNNKATQILLHNTSDNLLDFNIYADGMTGSAIYAIVDGNVNVDAEIY